MSGEAHRAPKMTCRVLTTSQYLDREVSVFIYLFTGPRPCGLCAGLFVGAVDDDVCTTYELR